MTEGQPVVETNRNIQLNWGTFNIPSLGGILLVAGLVFNAGQRLQEQEGRLSNIEISRIQKSAVADKMYDTINLNTAAIANLVYRMTAAEQNISNATARMDRQADNMQDFRGDLAKVNTSIELLSQQIKILLPEKKAELDATPPELASR